MSITNTVEYAVRAYFFKVFAGHEDFHDFHNSDINELVKTLLARVENFKSRLDDLEEFKRKVDDTTKDYYQEVRSECRTKLSKEEAVKIVKGMTIEEISDYL